MISVNELISKLHSPELSHISLGEINLVTASNQEIEAAATLIVQHPQLNSIDLLSINLSLLDFDKVNPIFLAIQQNHRIKKLYFSFSHLENIGDYNLNILYDCIKEKDEVSFSRNTLTNSSQAVDFIIKLTNANIKKLDLELNDLAKNGIRVIKSIVKALVTSNVECISLASNGIGSQHSCEEILKTLFSSKIIHIILNGNPLGAGTTDSDWEEIFSVLQDNKYIKNLSLFHCSLDLLEGSEPDIFAEQLANFIRKTNLEVLDITDNNFSAKLTSALIVAATHNKSLTLRCNGNNLSREQIIDVRASNLKEYFEATDSLPPSSGTALCREDTNTPEKVESSKSQRAYMDLLSIPSATEPQPLTGSLYHALQQPNDHIPSDVTNNPSAANTTKQTPLQLGSTYRKSPKLY